MPAEKQKVDCEACPLGKMMGQKGCPGTKLKLRIREWLKKHSTRSNGREQDY